MFSLVDADNDGLVDDTQLNLYVGSGANPASSIVLLDFQPQPENPTAGFMGFV